MRRTLSLSLAALCLAPMAAIAAPLLTAEKQPLNLHAIGMFFVFVLGTLAITWWAALVTAAIPLLYELVLWWAQRQRPGEVARTAHAHLRKEWFSAVSAMPGSELLAVREAITTQTALEAQLKQRIQQRMGDATRAIFDAGEVSWKRSKDGVALDTARLHKEHADLLKDYTVVKPGSRRFLVQT